MIWKRDSRPILVRNCEINPPDHTAENFPTLQRRSIIIDILPYLPQEWASLPLNSVIPILRGQILSVAEGPPGCAGMLNQNPKWVDPAATLLMNVFRGLTIQNEAEINSTSVF